MFVLYYTDFYKVFHCVVNTSSNVQKIQVLYFWDYDFMIKDIRFFIFICLVDLVFALFLQTYCWWLLHTSWGWFLGAIRLDAVKRRACFLMICSSTRLAIFLVQSSRLKVRSVASIILYISIVILEVLFVILQQYWVYYTSWSMRFYS